MAQTIEDVDLRVRSGDCLYRRDGLICAFMMAGSMLLAQPFVEMGFIDDWSYIKTAQVFSQTGHFVYNGWATATLGWQVLWGALFARLFGFSFVHVRLSTLPIAMASVYIFHQILVRFGISRGNAVFASLCLGLSPVFIAMSESYMTDVPGVFCTLLCLYLCQRVISAATDRARLGWLWFAMVTNIAGGTVRQTVWLGVLFILPSAVWLLRKRRVVLWGGALSWLIGVASIFALMRWFNQQPYFLTERIPIEVLTPPALKHTVLRELVLGALASLSTLVLLLPVLVAWLPTARSTPKRMVLWLFGISSALMAICLANYGAHGALGKLGEFAPWLPHVMGGLIPFGRWPRIIVTAVALVSSLALFLHLRGALRARGQFTNTHTPSWSHIFWLLMPYTVGFIGALFIRGLNDIWFDRYLLIPQAMGIILLLRCYQDFVVPGIGGMRSVFAIGDFPAVSCLALLTFAVIAVAGTHDWFALFRARLQAAEEVRRSGVPRTAIQGGFEYDGWTQLEVVGYVNEPRIQNPPDAFHAPPPTTVARPACATPWFSPSLFPAVVPRYFVVDAPLSCLDSTPFSAIPYRTWMPPSRGKVYVQKRKG